MTPCHPFAAALTALHKSAETAPWRAESTRNVADYFADDVDGRPMAAMGVFAPDATGTYHDDDGTFGDFKYVNAVCFTPTRFVEEESMDAGTVGLIVLLRNAAPSIGELVESVDTFLDVYDNTKSVDAVGIALDALRAALAALPNVVPS